MHNAAVEKNTKHLKIFPGTRNVNINVRHKYC